MGIPLLELPDGRRLDYRLSREGDGPVLLVHHGTPGSLTPHRHAERAAHERGLRVLAYSRAGYGNSSRKPGRRVVDVVGDCRHLLAAVGAERCYVTGASGGGPHALACAARMEEAVAVLVLAGVGPYGAEGLDFLAGMGQDNLDEFGATLEGEESLRRYLDSQAPGLRAATPEQIVEQLQSLLPEVDRACITGETGEDLAASMAEALRHSTDGWLDDDLAFANSWGFELSEVTNPVILCQGSADLMVPYAHGKWLAEHVPGARVHLMEGEGHLSIGVRHIEKLLDELLALA